MKNKERPKWICALNVVVLMFYTVREFKQNISLPFPGVCMCIACSTARRNPYIAFAIVVNPPYCRTSCSFSLGRLELWVLHIQSHNSSFNPFFFFLFFRAVVFFSPLEIMQLKPWVSLTYEWYAIYLGWTTTGDTLTSGIEGVEKHEHHKDWWRMLFIVSVGSG